MEKLNLDKNNLKKFGITIGMVFLLITIFVSIRHQHSILTTSIISIIFFILTSVSPVLLKPLYILWMRLAYLLTWINTRLILCIIFYLVFTPIGLVMRLFGVDLLDRKIYPNKESYWKKKEKKDFNPFHYVRRF